MILITKATTNTLTLTLTEKCYLPNPYFLFNFKNEVNGVEINIILADTSQFTDRYNRFSFIEPTNGTMLEGYWSYTVYEQASAVNTDPELAYGVVEIGKIKVVDATTPADSTIYDSQPNTSTVYN